MLEKHSVLIVDDDSGLRRTLADILEARGYVPLAVANGRDTLEAIQAVPPAVALIDLKLQDIPGLELMRRIKAQSPDTECILLTGHASQQSAIQAVNIGAFSYLQKPYDVEQLLLAIHRAIEKREARLALQQAADVWQRTFDTMSDMVTLQDNEFRILRANQAVAQALGCRPEELIGQKCYHAIHGMERPIQNCPFYRTQQSRQMETTEVWEPLFGKWLSITTNPLHDETGDMVGVVHVMHDITKRVETEKALRQLNADLKRRNQELLELHAISQRQLNELRVLHGVAMTGIETSDEDELLARVTEVIGEALYPDHFGVLLLDEAAGVLRVHPSFRGISEQHRRIAVPLGRGVSGRVAASGKPIRLRDVSQIPDYIDTTPGMRSELAVPIKLGEQILGVINAESQKPDAFAEEDERLLTTLAGQLALALQEVRLYQAAVRSAERWQILHRATQALARVAQDPERVYTAVHEAARQLIPAEAFVIALLDESQQTLDAVYLVDKGGRWPPQTIPAHQGLSGTVITRGESIKLDNFHPGHSSLKPGHFGDPEHVRSILVVPMQVGEKITGVISCQSYQPHAYTIEDQRLLEMLAAHAATALENAHLFQAERRRAEETATLLATSQAITSLDLDVVLETIAGHAKALFEADGSRIHLLEQDGKSLRCAVALHDRAEQVVTYPLKVGQGITGRVAQNGVAEIIANTLEDPAMIQVPGTPVEPESVALAPLRTQAPTLGGKSNANNGQGVIGVMTVTRLGENRPFTPGDLPLLTTFANLAAVAIEKARLYTSLQASNRDLEAALRAKEEMIQNVSHELRTPLALILGYGEMLDNGTLGPLTEEQAEGLAVVTRQAKHLRTMVERLLTLQTLDKAGLHKSPVQLAELLRLLRQTWQAQATQAGIELRVEVPAHLPVLTADRQLLSQVMDNLVENAFKFSPQGGIVAIKAWQEDKEVILAVADQGIGMTQDQLQHVFQRFYQVEAGLSRRFGGMGIGLALCRAIVRAHEGRIWAESEGPGRGSVFYVALPLN